MNQDAEYPEGSEYCLDIQPDTERHGCSRNTIYNLMKKGVLPSELVVVVGRGGRRVKKYLIKVEDLDSTFSTEKADHHVAAVMAAAPPFAEKQKVHLFAHANPGTRR